MSRKSVYRGVAAIGLLATFVTTAASTLLFENAGTVNTALGVSSSIMVQDDSGTSENTIRYDNQFGTDTDSNQSAMMVEMNAAQETITQEEEGAVLLRNENQALPMDASSRITIFGNGSQNPHYNKSKESSTIDSIPMVTFNSAMQDAFGKDNVNLTLADNVYSSMDRTSGAAVNEADISEVKKYESSWQSDYNDAAVVVLTRWGGEDDDASLYTDDGTPYLSLSKNEQALLEYLQQEKAAGIFKRIVVIINTDQGMELGWMDDYDIDACILAGAPGTQGFEAIGEIMNGTVNPSGHTVDTYAVNSFSSPAMTYANGNTPTWSNTDVVNSTVTDNNNDGAQIDYYTIYAEGIYVGYKYYETRYEDTVLGQGNADSTTGSSTDQGWNYTDEVAYPFGYGLSYTTFDQTLNNVSYDEDTDTYEINVTVTNTGDAAGKSVVEVYAQTPYGDYEKENRIEKSAVVLAGFEKTDDLQPGESAEVTVEVERYLLASYDENNLKGYYLSDGDYYLAIGDNAHDALNNILAAKGKTTADGMDADGNADKVYSWTLDTQDSDSYKMSRYDQDVEVTNQFDFADLNYYGIDFTYLSRNDWEGTYPSEQISVEATDEMMEGLNTNWYQTPDDAPAVSDFTQDADKTIMFASMTDVDWDDEETWNTFLNQLSVEDMTKLVSDSYGNPAVESVALPARSRNDDGTSLLSNITALNTTAMAWPSEAVTARTWNKDRFEARGETMGIEAVYAGVNEIWYGGGNIRRTPFNGRGVLYYSEDGNMGYYVGQYEAQGMQSVGVNYCIKHFVLNDQEAHRESLSTFSNEQAIREEYLRAFEGALTKGGALGVMTSFNRIGVQYSATCRNLLTNVLKGEWAFKGHVVTDAYVATSLYKNHFLEQLAAGIDYVCWDDANAAAAIQQAINDGDGYILQCLRESAKHNVYALSHTISVNGLSSNARVISIVPAWQLALIITAAVSFALFVVMLILYIVTGIKDSRQKAAVTIEGTGSDHQKKEA